jgi:hypothetical protein
MSYHHTPQSSNLLDVLEKILDKGVVIAGDIKISLADVDLLTIKIRLLVASVDKAKEIGMDWWETDSYYSSKTKHRMTDQDHAKLIEKVNRLEQIVESHSLQQLTLPDTQNLEEVQVDKKGKSESHKTLEGFDE